MNKLKLSKLTTEGLQHYLKLNNHGEYKKGRLFLSQFEKRTYELEKLNSSKLPSVVKYVSKKVKSLLKGLKKRNDNIDRNDERDADLYFNKKGKANMVNFYKQSENKTRQLTETYLNKIEDGIFGVDRKVLGDSELGYDNEKIQNYHVSMGKLYSKLEEKFGTNRKESVMILGIGRFENDNGKAYYYPITFRHHHLYSNMSDNSYFMLLASVNCVMNDKDSYTSGLSGSLYLKSMSDVVLLHGTATNINDIPLHGKSLMHQMLEQLNTTKMEHTEGFCLFDMIVNTVSAQPKHKTFNALKFKAQLDELGIDYRNLTNNNVVTWRNAYCPSMSIYALDAMKNITINLKSSDSHCFCLKYVHHDMHCFPITGDLKHSGKIPSLMKMK
jgi:hypothetical protein